MTLQRYRRRSFLKSNADQTTQFFNRALRLPKESSSRQNGLWAGSLEVDVILLTDILDLRFQLKTAVDVWATCKQWEVCRLHCHSLKERGRVVTAALTWHCEVLSVYDLILSIIELVVVLLRVSVQILQVGNHRHTPPRVSALRVGRDGHRGLCRRVFLSHPAGTDGQRDHRRVSLSVAWSLQKLSQTQT